MLIYCGIKLVGIVMATFGPNYATFVIGRFFVACYFGCCIAGYVIGENTLIITCIYIIFLFLPFYYYNTYIGLRQQLTIN